MLSETARVFLETSSIRGVGKVVKTQNVVLSRMWAVFLLGTTSLLFYSVFKITAEYMQYDVNIQTYQEIDDATPFPAVSICNNQPFSLNAYQKWSAKQVKSPTEFNNDLRKQALKLFNETNMKADFRKLLEAAAKKQPDIAGGLREKIRIQGVKSMSYSLIYDNARMYYQNMPPDDALVLGHTRNESIVDCIFKYGSIQVLGTSGCQDSMIEVQTFSDPNYFNCLTLEFNPEYVKDIISLTLIVWLGPDDSYDIRYRQSFLNEVYEQAYGLRVLIHEPKTQPRVAEQGLQTEPGKMNEIKYQPVKFVRQDTPKNPCISPEKSEKLKFSDLKMSYNYDFELCMNSKVQEVVLQKCKCMYIELPRVAMPNKTHPYCGFLDEKLAQRSQCVRDLNLREIRKTFEGKDCFPRCEELGFEKELSMTKWRETKWMLHWIKELCQRWDSYFRHLYGANMEDFEKSLGGISDYLTRPNITDLTLLGNSSQEAFDFNDRFSFLVVKRQSNNTLVKKEKIVLTLNALFSRIGGLCSVYIGLTLTFIMEIIDLCFRVLTGNRSKQPQQQQQQPQQQQPQQPQPQQPQKQGNNGAAGASSGKAIEAAGSSCEEQQGLVKSVAELDFAPDADGDADQVPDCRHNQIWIRQADSRV